MKPPPAPDARPVAATSDAAPAAADAAGSSGGSCRFRFCEDFEAVVEGGLPSTKIWARVGQSHMKVESRRAAHGRKSLHVQAPPGEVHVSLRETRVSPTLVGGLYGRAYVYVESRPPQFLHWDFVELSGRAPLGGAVVRYGAISQGAQHYLLFNMDMGGGQEAGVSDDHATTFPDATWACLEWFFDAERNEARLWWNGKERPRLHYQDDKKDPVFQFPRWQALGIGVGQYQPTDAPLEVWFDDVALHDRRIGCDP